MKAFAVKTSIRATPDRIWALLTDAPGYPKWNNTVDKIDGRIADGQSITVHAKINPDRAFPEALNRSLWARSPGLGVVPV